MTLKKTVALVGMMGAGKTSLGRRLAARLEVPFRDADQEIETAAGLTVSEIFDQIRRTLFPRWRAAGDCPPAGRGAARAGHGRRRLHGPRHPRRDERQRLHRLAQGTCWDFAVAGEKARYPPPAAGTAIRWKPSRRCLRYASRSMPRPTSRWNAPTNRITARWTAS